MIQGTFNFSDITSVVENEHNTNWKGKVETSAGANAVLGRYWSLLGINNWSAQGTPWSAAYISWVMRKLDNSFPKGAAHRLYAKKGLDNRNAGKKGYQLFSLNREKEPIKCQLGDILIAPRSGGYTASHGDVIYKIDGTTAYLAGGNVGQTNKISSTISLKSDGSYREKVKKYLVVLKRVD